MNKYKKTITEALKKGVCSDWEAWIKDRHPELFEEKFKVGDWITCATADEPSIDRVVKIDSIGYYISKEALYDPSLTGLRKATKEEIEAHLIEEAKRRGFVKGARVKWIRTSGTEDNGEDKITQGFVYHPKEDKLTEYDYENLMIYKKGQWAEIIKPIPKTLQLAIDELGEERIKELLG